MYDSVATLYSAVETADTYGNIVETLTGKQVFVKPRSLYANEFYNAATSGLKPEVVLILSNPEDYSGEKTVDFNGTRYEVIRVYQKPERDAVELTLQTAVGV